MNTTPSQDPRLAQAIGDLHIPHHRADFFEDLDELLVDAYRQELIEPTRPRLRRRLALATTVLAIVVMITGFVWMGADPPAVDRDVVGSVAASTEPPPPSNAGGGSTTVLPSTPAPATMLTDYEWRAHPAGTATFAAHEGHKVELRGLAVRDDVVVIAATVLTETDRCRWAAMWTSSDGLNWDRVPHDDALFGIRSPDDTEVCSSTTQDVVATDSGFLAIGDRDGAPVTWQSEDGRVWTMSEMGVEDGFLMSAASAGGTTVIAGLSSGAPVVLSSQDGTTWMQRTVPPIPGQDGPSLTVVDGPAGFLLVGEYQSGTDFLAASWSSSNGTTWEPAGDLPLRGNFQPAVGPIVADENGYRVFGWADEQSVAITSRNGVDWATQPASAELANAHGAAVSRVGIVVVGSDSSAYTDADPVVTPMALVSPTGDDWTRLDPEPVAKQSGLGFVEPIGDHFIAVGTARDGPGAPKQAVATWVAAPPGTF